jgi:heme a synthase
VLILIGGFVSASGSGLACPDWPTCHGQVLPVLSGPVLVEFSHRLFALVVSLFVTGTVLVAWRSYRESKGVLALSTASFVLLLAQVFLGMVTVKSELNSLVTTAHLGLATGVFGVVLSNAFLVRSLRQNQERISRRVLA